MGFVAISIQRSADRPDARVSKPHRRGDDRSLPQSRRSDRRAYGKFPPNLILQRLLPRAERLKARVASIAPIADLNCVSPNLPFALQPDTTLPCPSFWAALRQSVTHCGTTALHGLQTPAQIECMPSPLGRSPTWPKNPTPSRRHFGC